MQSTEGGSKDEFKSDVLVWAPIEGHASIGLPARTYINFVQTKDAA